MGYAMRPFSPLAQFARLLLLLLVLAVTIAPLHAAPAPQSLAAVLDHILAGPALRGGVTGAVVVRVRDGKVLYAHNPDLRLLPASNRKLFTAAAALGILGDDWTYKTQVLASAKPDSAGVVHGDVILRGVGDGALTTADMDDLVMQMAKAGVRRIDGSVIGDASLFTGPQYGFGWEWDDLSDEEFPVISSLEVNSGDIQVHVVHRFLNVSTVVIRTPPVDYPVIDNQAQALPVGSPNTCVVVRPYGEDTVRITGNLPMSASLDRNVPVANPALYALNVLNYCLRVYGITTRGLQVSGRDRFPLPSVVLATHVSLPLAKYLPLMMKPSDNLIAESLVRTVGAAKGTAGTYDAGHALETPFFQSLGVDTTSIDLVDGCGVGRRNFVTARAVGQLLVGMSKRPDFAAYYDALPIAGVDGTLKSRMTKTRAAGNVHAKTGTLSQARALSGYVTGPHGGLYAFSLIMNNFPGNARSAGDVQDKFVERLADTLPPMAH